ncbi:phenylalanine--tRNA ligase subunit beta [Candidatus Uhrbacteria bacterium CG_4_9_14_0_2_um_filter_41_50]|uniref:Phenylalanine--tRNA ligase beta subunit n=1 Tax=Candidatus Uhrbacteria bacterium CG_4_9_14_0_2_um_filter_41_50 TaxID=1975031 RepID=A0A2M8EPJ9_9BACT|nr:MAG: phenylalanine--tRNA ligase subunit beta [Candidatus Uhrbacteria bacterium CG_4_10_14_3_um_filter_41_21]PIZ54867.1 MAG: phenylalanine--tRNA ligase subunit beta [Candidatus Uhrbacteria bacterium CG_4_10_14_0_2_um_filter_41_21]PJB84705.1 MAG: phenylalanine--tRNA ligase subunit beta [Candidatus Uhrbacteria bacterium CG_4_9_14_0_8_um_filter_41_16]PJC24621.1 MAG: phenylalanine--tRNA ligase subunit beta [Candidatus Uhrbacteria bacterium CG_4_9_14_0_2_um_filter_41_50]PJE75393.1 MAG: phenylalani
MNILASYKWIKEYLKTDASSEDFAFELTQKAFSVERILKMRELLSGIVVGEILEISDHPNAQKLHLAKVNIGKSEPLNLIFGSMAEMQVGMKVPVAVAPCTMPDGKKIEKRTMRGEVSEGMLCLDQELGFLSSGVSIRKFESQVDNGTPLVEALDMDDYVFDIEVTTNRPDAMSIIGLAREGSVVTGDAFKFDQPSLPNSGEGKNISVQVDEQDLCSRYMAVVVDGVKVGPSPMWLQSKLLLAGHRPINNIVDITNYILHEYGQPLHAFDYDKVDGQQIIVRKAKDGEKIVALDEVEYQLTKNDLVIADQNKPIAIAGVMGGQESGTWEKTTTIIFEAATFDPVSVRKTGRGLNLFSDSQLLFEKGLSTKATEFALAKAVELTLEIAGGSVASEIIDVQAGEYSAPVFGIKPQKVRDLMGVDIEDDEMVNILMKLGFIVTAGSGEFTITVPYWRDHDIEGPVDLAEEIARIYGYQNIKPSLPLSPQPNYAGDMDLVWEGNTRKFLVSVGYTELYGYSFVSEQDLVRYDLDPEKAMKVYNPLSAELTHMRTSLMPSLLKDIRSNQGHTPSGKVFEISRVYITRADDLPEERTQLVFGEFGTRNVEQSFLNTKGVLETWAGSVGLEISFERLNDDAYWHQGRSASILYNGKDIGIIGQVSDKYQSAYGIDWPVIVALVDFAAVVDAMHKSKHYEAVSEFPAIIRDIAVVIDERSEFADIGKLIASQGELIESVDVVDVYRGQGIDKGKKSITLSIVLRARDKTLESGEADEVMKKIQDVLKDRLGAVVR